MTAIGDRAAFIRANTRVRRLPLCPELQLHLADDAVALWTMTEEELGALGLPPPFWAFAWAGGQALARYLLDNPAIVRGKQALDVAAGSGLVAIAARLAGAAAAIGADIDAFAAVAIELNAKLNGVAVAVSTESPIGTAPDAEIILIGDLFYERDLARQALAWLKDCAAAGKTVLVGDPGRSYFPKESFVSLAEYQVPVTRALEDAEIKRTGVWRLAD